MKTTAIIIKIVCASLIVALGVAIFIFGLVKNAETGYFDESGYLGFSEPIAFVFAGLLIFFAGIYLLANIMHILANHTKSKKADVPSEIIKYKNFLDSNIITQEEFDAKKRELLNL